MTIEQFNIQPTSSAVVNIIVMAMIVIGVVLIVASLAFGNRLKGKRSSYGKNVGVGLGMGGKYRLTILGIALIVIGGLVIYTASSSVVTIGSGYINVESKDFTYAGAVLPVKGNKNVTSEEITLSFVGQIGSGNFTLHKEYGLNFGETNTGVFTLGNGAKAYVATTNSTSLIIELKSGEYLIVGNQDTQALANSFSQNVHQLTPQQIG